MAIKINQNSGGGGIKVNMPQQKPQQPTREQQEAALAAQQAAVRATAEQQVRQQATVQRPYNDFDAPLGGSQDPFNDTLDSFDTPLGATNQFEPVQQMQPQMPYSRQEEVVEENNDEDDNNNKRGKRGKNKKDKKDRKPGKRDKSKKKGKGDDTPISVDAAYKSYRAKKIGVLATFIAFLVALIVFGTYSTFFKHDLTAYEAAVYTNAYNSQSTSQQWDSGVQSFLEANLYTMLQTNFSTTGDVKSFEVDNISVERNIAYGETLFLTFFSADVVANGESERVFMSIWISVADGKYEAASSVSISSRAAYSSYDGTTVENVYLVFDDRELNNDNSSSFESALDNFLTLGYNTGGDISQIYIGDSELDFSGATYIDIVSCSVYDEENQLGFNAVATYELLLDNGVQYTTTSYYDISLSSSGAWVIERVL